MKLINKDALVAEIDKLKGKVSDGSSYCNGWQHALRILELSLDTLEVKEEDLQEESKTDWLRELKDKLDSLSKEDFEKVIAKYSIYGKEEPVSEDLPHIRHRDTLDEFAYQCAYDLSNDWAKETPEWRDVKTACKLGAKWQKEQMMEKTIDAKCFGFQGAALFSFRLPASNYLVGSEVKVIVIKEAKI